VTAGGNALKYYASVRIDVRKGEAIKNGQDVLGNRIKAKVVKNKVSPPFKSAEFDIIFGKGISREGDVLDIATKADIIDKSGAWFSYNNANIGQGRENAKKYLADNPEVLREIEAKVKEVVIAKPTISYEESPNIFDEADADVEEFAQ